MTILTLLVASSFRNFENCENFGGKGTLEQSLPDLHFAPIKTVAKLIDNEQPSESRARKFQGRNTSRIDVTEQSENFNSKWPSRLSRVNL